MLLLLLVTGFGIEALNLLIRPLQTVRGLEVEPLLSQIKKSQLGSGIYDPPGGGPRAKPGPSGFPGDPLEEMEVSGKTKPGI